jgi:hypothetical protein
MAPHDANYLFSEYDLGDVLRAQIATAGKRVDAVPEQRFSAASDEDLTAEIERDLEIRPLELLEAERTMSQHEAQLDVSGSWDRNPFRDPGPIHVPAVRVVVSTPFRGDPNLWRMRPNAWQSRFPQGRVNARGNEGGELQIEYTKPADEDNQKLAQFVETTFKDLRFFIGHQARQIQQELSKVPNAIAEAIQRRRARLRAHDDLSNVLGIPMSAPANLAAPERTERPENAPPAAAARRRAPETTWDLFLSHASEDKDAVARPLAQALRQAGLSVWFDEFTLRLGDSLRRSIDHGLARSRFGIVVISPAFLNKEWPQRELDGLVAREVRGRKVILPVWHDVDVEVVTAYSPTLADRIAARTEWGLERVVQAIRDAMT